MDSLAPPCVLIADDHALIREGIGLLVRGEWPGARCQYAADLEGVRLALTVHGGSAAFDAIVLDLKMPGMSGLDSVTEVCALALGAQVIVCTAIEDPGLEKRLASAGVSGVVSKNRTSDQLIAAIRYALHQKGRSPAGPVKPAHAQTRSKGSTMLTTRQREILHLLHQGKPNKVIATHLGVEVGTVKSHLHALYAALDVANRSEAIAKSQDWFI